MFGRMPETVELQPEGQNVTGGLESICMEIVVPAREIVATCQFVSAVCGRATTLPLLPLQFEPQSCATHLPAASSPKVALES